MTTKQIQEKTLSIQERGERIQRQIMKIMAHVFTILSVIWKFTKPLLLMVVHGIYKLINALSFGGLEKAFPGAGTFLKKAKEGAFTDLARFRQNVDIGKTMSRSVEGIMKETKTLMRMSGTATTG